ncbi:MAG: pyocin knob domain-containing protein [Collinsella sp.]
MKYTIDSAEKDLDKLVSFGVYSVKSPVNAPSGVTDWANVIVVPTNGSNVYVAQMLVTHGGVIYSRGKGGGDWDIWKVIKRDAL